MKDSTKPSRTKKADGRGLDGEGSAVGSGLRGNGATRGKPEGAASGDGKEPKAPDGGAGDAAGGARRTSKTEAPGKLTAKAQKSKTKAPADGAGGADGARETAAATSSPADDQELVTLRLYVAGQTPRSLAALANLRKVCDEYLAPRYKIELEIVDLMEKPQLAQADQIFAIPTLVRKLPSPIKRIIGDLSNTERVLIGLDIHGGK